ncbi:hypothetical protein BRD22_04285 [Halobacteriales archaeon SW_8_68_21]|nr:MAG: hypothetical protein BRD22_04285 [Halobacteriales archaeon SW_8_68_21]
MTDARITTLSRRRLAAGLGGAVAGTLAGCLGDSTPGDGLAADGDGGNRASDEPTQPIDTTGRRPRRGRDAPG